MIAPVLRDQRAAAVGDGCQHHHPPEVGGVVHQQRRHQQDGDRIGIPDGIAGDEEPGPQPEEQRGGQPIRAAPDAAGQHQDGKDDDARPDRHLQRHDLAQHQHGEGGRQQRTRGAGGGVDKRQVALAVTCLQQKEIAQMQRDCAQHEGDLPRAEVRLAHQHDPDRHRQVDQDGYHREQPDQFRPAADALDEDIPCGVAEGGGDDKRQTGKRHCGTSWLVSDVVHHALSIPSDLLCLGCLHHAHNGARTGLPFGSGTLAAHG